MRAWLWYKTAVNYVDILDTQRQDILPPPLAVIISPLGCSIFATYFIIPVVNPFTSNMPVTHGDILNLTS